MLGSRKPLYITQIVALNATWIFLFDCSFIPQYITVTKDTIKYTPAFIDRRVIDRSALWLDISGFLDFFLWIVYPRLPLVTSCPIKIWIFSSWSRISFLFENFVFFSVFAGKTLNSKQSQLCEAATTVSCLLARISVWQKTKWQAFCIVVHEVSWLRLSGLITVHSLPNRRCCWTC